MNESTHQRLVPCRDPPDRWPLGTSGVNVPRPIVLDRDASQHGVDDPRWCVDLEDLLDRRRASTECEPSDGSRLGGTFAGRVVPSVVPRTPFRIRVGVRHECPNGLHLGAGRSSASTCNRPIPLSPSRLTVWYTYQMVQLGMASVQPKVRLLDAAVDHALDKDRDWTSASGDCVRYRLEPSDATIYHFGRDRACSFPCPRSRTSSARI